MVFPRDVLNKIKWTHEQSLEGVVIWYIHRGAPGDVLMLTGNRVTALGRAFFETDDAMIPYHRILRIDFDGKTVFDRRKETRRKR